MLNMVSQFFLLLLLSQFIFGDLQDGYEFTNQKMNYDSAVKYCADQQRKLVQISDSNINQLVYNLAVQRGLGTYWINGNDINYESDWVNTDGQFIRYKPWQYVEPNGGRVENCIHGNFYANGEWNDTPCSSLNSVICDRLPQ